MADEIIVKYQADVKGAEKSLNSYIKTTEKVDSTTKKTTKDVEKSYTGMSQSVTASLKSVAGAVGIAFGTQQILSFGKEAVQLAGKMQGVERAFNKLNKPDLLSNLRKATRGTVTDLELMRQAVRAQNFQVPLEKLASFFEFATKRSIETGESVDYLVSSIIDGIGRKSTLVLDNLGISATQLQAEIKKTGDFGEAAANIISRSLTETGEVIDTTTIKMAQLSTEYENAKVAFGDALITLATGLGTSLGIIDEIDPQLRALNRFMQTFTQWRMEDLNDGTRELSDIYVEIEDQLKKVNALKAEEEALGSSSNDRKRRQEIIDLLQEEELRLDTLRNIFEAYKKTLEAVDVQEKETIKNLKFYNDLIKELKKKQGEANKTRKEVRDLEDEINEAIRQRLILLGRLREVGGATMQQIETIAAGELEVQEQLTDDILADYAHRNGEIEKGIQKRNAMEARLAEERKEQEKQVALQTTEQALSGISSLVSSISQIQQNAFQEEQNQLQQQLEQGLITREQFDDKTKEIRRKQAQADKDAALFQAVIATAQSVMQALANSPPPASYALAAVAGALGAAQIAAIASQPLPQFATGVIDLQGEGTATSDSIHAKLSRGESVMTAKETKKHKGLLNAIRSNKYEQYLVENELPSIVSNLLGGGMGAIGDSIKLNSVFNDKNLLKLGDRNRSSAKDDAKFIVNGIVKGLNRGGSRWS